MTLKRRFVLGGYSLQATIFYRFTANLKCRSHSWMRRSIFGIFEKSHFGIFCFLKAKFRDNKLSCASTIFPIFILWICPQKLVVKSSHQTLPIYLEKLAISTSVRSVAKCFLQALNCRGITPFTLESELTSESNVINHSKRNQILRNMSSMCMRNTWNGMSCYYTGLFAQKTMVYFFFTKNTVEKT